MSDEAQEKSLETLQEAVHEIHSAEAREKWMGWVALASGLIAALAAVVGLYETQATSKTILTKNEAILLQSKASDQWNFYQAKSIKGHIYEVVGRLLPSKDAEYFLKEGMKYSADKAEIKKRAEEFEKQVEGKNAEGEKYYEQHHKLSYAETFLHIAIALASISALTRRKEVLVAAVGLAGCGIFFFLRGVL
ncbi:MAG: DUF4337 domain-containing protein [Nitrospinae bacterium]|nr:DUF4337 domain-containing protein [Nitrospinota bacterium]